MDKKTSDRIKQGSTLIVDQYIKAATLDQKSRHNYKDLAIHALPGLHQFIENLAGEYFRPGQVVLDLAAGSGAMSQRLKDCGFEVIATDYVSNNFRLHDSIPFFQINLNEYFSEKINLPIDSIVASEIIEHLENPRNFARECFHLLPAGGTMILSTPNIDSAVSKALFVRSGTFLWFDEAEYVKSGHITPLAQKQIHEIFNEYGFDFIWEGSFGNAEERIGGSPRILWLSKFLKFLSSTGTNGEIFVCVLRKRFSEE